MSCDNIVSDVSENVSVPSSLVNVNDWMLILQNIHKSWIHHWYKSTLQWHSEGPVVCTVNEAQTVRKGDNNRISVWNEVWEKNYETEEMGSIKGMKRSRRNSESGPSVCFLSSVGKKTAECMWPLRAAPGSNVHPKGDCQQGALWKGGRQGNKPWGLTLVGRKKGNF